MVGASVVVSTAVVGEVVLVLEVVAGESVVIFRKVFGVAVDIVGLNVSAVVVFDAVDVAALFDVAREVVGESVVWKAVIRTSFVVATVVIGDTEALVDVDVTIVVIGKAV